MFEKEAEERVKHLCLSRPNAYVPVTSVEYWQDGAEFGYNKGYHDAEEHYLNVIDSQHKLVDESKKKDFRKCMKCTNSTYQSGFKDCYNKANEWHKPSEKLPERCSLVLAYAFDDTEPSLYQFVTNDQWEWMPRRIAFLSNDQIRLWKEIVLPELPKEIKEK